MTKSFSLSALVPALSGVAALVPVAAWHDFNTPGWQGVSALPVLFPVLLLAGLWVKFSKSMNHLAVLALALVGGAWHAFLWFAALTQPHRGGFPAALGRAAFELLYSASPVFLVGLAGSVASLGLMMSVSPVRGPQD